MTAFSLSITDGIALLTLDVPGEPVNALGSGIIGELEGLLARIRDDAGARAVVLISGKPDHFVAGADIQEFIQIRTAQEGEALSRAGQEMIGRVERFPKPIVVAIHGACLGLGCELALACAWRVASDSAKTVIGLPEVQIGILPGAGGCQRLPRLIGVRAALDIILAGRSERAAKAFKLGLVDELVPPSILRHTAVAAADRIARQGVPLRQRTGSLLLDRNPLGRRLLYTQPRKPVPRKTGAQGLQARSCRRAGAAQHPAPHGRGRRRPDRPPGCAPPAAHRQPPSRPQSAGSAPALHAAPEAGAPQDRRPRPSSSVL